MGAVRPRVVVNPRSQCRNHRHLPTQLPAYPPATLAKDLWRQRRVIRRDRPREFRPRLHANNRQRRQHDQKRQRGPGTTAPGLPPQPPQRQRGEPLQEGWQRRPLRREHSGQRDLLAHVHVRRRPGAAFGTEIGLETSHLH